MAYLYLLLSIYFSMGHAEETKTLGSQLLEQVEDKTPQIDVDQCRTDLELVYSKLSSVYTVNLQTEPFLIETFFDWSMMHRIAVPLVFSMDQNAYEEYVNAASKILDKYASATSVSAIPNQLLDAGNDYNQVEIRMNGNKVPIFLVMNTGAILRYWLPHECFPVDRVDLEFYDNMVYYYARQLFRLGAQFQFLTPDGSGFAGRVLLDDSERFRTETRFFMKGGYGDESVTDFPGHIYLGYLPKNRNKPSIIVDTGHDDTYYLENGSYENSPKQAANPLVIRPGFFKGGHQQTVVDSISSVIYLGVSEHTTEVLKSSEQFIVQFYTPSLTPNTNLTSGVASASGTESALAMTVLQKDNTKYQIAIGQTLDAELAIAEAKKYALQAFVTDNILVGPFLSPSQKAQFSQRVLEDLTSFILDASLDLYTGSSMAVPGADPYVFTAVVTVDGEKMMSLALQDYPTPTKVDIAPLIITYQKTMQIRRECTSTLHSVYELAPSFWQVRQNGDIRISEHDMYSVELTIPIQIFIDEVSFGKFKNNISTLMSSKSYPLVETGTIQISNNAGAPWGDTKGETRWYLAQSGDIQNGRLFVQGYRLPCGLSDDDSDDLVYDVQENNRVRIKLLDATGDEILSESFNLARESHDSYHGRFSDPGSEYNDPLYPLVGLNIIGPWFFGTDGKNASGYYHTEYYPSTTFTQVIDKEIVLTLSKEKVKKIASVETELDLYDLEF